MWRTTFIPFFLKIFLLLKFASLCMLCNKHLIFSLFLPVPVSFPKWTYDGKKGRYVSCLLVTRNQQEYHSLLPIFNWPMGKYENQFATEFSLLFLDILNHFTFEIFINCLLRFVIRYFYHWFSVQMVSQTALQTLISSNFLLFVYLF